MSFEKELIDLDECVINALNLFTREKIPKLELGKFKRLLVIGSGNAAVTGKIIFNNKDAVFADEGNYKRKLETIKGIDKGVLISASGGKHAPIIAKTLKRKKIKSILLTNNKEAMARKFISRSYVFPKNTEPYTYNTSTYLSMIFAKTREKPSKILNYIKRIEKSIPINFNKFDAFYIMVPEKFDLVREMFLTKFDELFGSKISGRVFTLEQTKHAKTIVSSNKEFFISFGYKNKIFGKYRYNVPLYSEIDFGGLIAIGYYVIGKIQKQNPSYFKQNIVDYTKKASKIFKQEIKPIVK